MKWDRWSAMSDREQQWRQFNALESIDRAVGIMFGLVIVSLIVNACTWLLG